MAPGKHEMTDETVQRFHDKQVEGAIRYAAADRSDPFTLNRCLGHIRQGICGPVIETEGFMWDGHKITGNAGANGHYDAIGYTVMRETAAGEHFPVTEYKSVVRP